MAFHFNQYSSYKSNPQIDSRLPIEQIISQDYNLIDGIKNKNYQQLNYFYSNPGQVRHMLKIIMNDCFYENLRKDQKVVQTCMQIFELNQECIMEIFFNKNTNPNNENLVILFKFLEQSFDYNDNQKYHIFSQVCGYFNSLFHLLFDFKSYELVEFFLKNKAIQKNMLGFMEFIPIQEVMLTILQSKYSNQQNMIETKQSIINDLVFMTINDQIRISDFARNNCANLLYDNLKNETKNDINYPQNYFSSQSVNQLFLVFQSKSLENQKYNSLKLLIMFSQIISTIGEQDQIKTQIYKKEIIQQFSKNFKQIQSNLTEDNGKQLNTTFKADIKTVGKFRLKLVELFTCLLKIYDDSIYDSFDQNQTIFVLIELFFQYEWNSVFHNLVLNFIKQVFKTKSKKLIDQVFIKGQIIHRIAMYVQKPPMYFKNKKKYVRNQLGHVIEFSNIINKQSQKNEDVLAHTDHSDEWLNFTENQLVYYNDKVEIDFTLPNIKDMKLQSRKSRQWQSDLFLQNQDSDDIVLKFFNQEC